MGRKSSRTSAAAPPPPPVYHHEAPGCFNGIWNGAAEVADIDTPVIARKSLSERKFSEGFEAPRNSLDIGSAVFESARSCASVVVSTPADEIPFGFEFALRKSAPPRVSVQASNSSSTESGRCRSPSVIARLMGLDTLPAEQPQSRVPPRQQQQQQQQRSLGHSTSELHAWNLMSERRELLTSRSSKEHRVQEKQHCLTRQLSSSRLESSDKFLLFDVLPFRDHPQEKQLEKLKQEFQARRQIEAKLQLLQKASGCCSKAVSGNNASPELSSRCKPDSKEILDAIHFLQSNKEFLVKFLQEPNSVFAKHIYDLQATAAAEAAAEASRFCSNSNSNLPSKAPSGTVHQDNIGFSRKLVESKKDHPKATLVRSNNGGNNNITTRRKESDVVQRQRKDSPHDKLILLKPNVKKQSNSAPCSGTATPTSHRTKLEETSTTTTEPRLRRSRSFKEVDTPMDPRALARQIARQVRENVDKELSLHEASKVNSTFSRSCSWSEMDIGGGGEVSEPSSRRYSKDFQVHQSTASLPNSPKLPKSNVNTSEGRRHFAEKLRTSQSEDESSRELFIQIEVTKNREAAHEEPRKHKGGKLLKLFTKDPQKTSSDHSPRLLPRSKSVPGVEEKSDPEVLERTHSCKQSTSTNTSRVSPPSESSHSKGKFSSLKTSLLGKKKSTDRSRKTQGTCQHIEHLVPAGYEDHYTRTFRETEAQLASSYGSCHPENNKLTFDPQSPSYLCVDISEGLDHLDTSSDIHLEKSEQPSPVSVLERGFIEGSPSPVSFEDVSSDLQELQLRLERLRLDESGRTDRADSTTASDISPSPSSGSPYSQDHLYIEKLMHASGFDKSVTSLYNWHSPSCPIDPFLFGKLEEEYSSCDTPSAWQGKGGTSSRGSRTNRKLKIGRSPSHVERRPDTLHRQMVFDVVNEVLSRKFEYLWNEQPWQEIGKQGIKAVPRGKYLVREVVREVDVFRHEYDSCEYPLENLVERDVNRGSDSQWLEMRDELRKITAQVEENILDSLVEELAASFICPVEA